MFKIVISLFCIFLAVNSRVINVDKVNPSRVLDLAPNEVVTFIGDNNDPFYYAIDIPVDSQVIKSVNGNNVYFDGIYVGAVRAIGEGVDQIKVKEVRGGGGETGYSVTFTLSVRYGNIPVPNPRYPDPRDEFEDWGH